MMQLYTTTLCRNSTHQLYAATLYHESRSRLYSAIYTLTFHHNLNSMLQLYTLTLYRSFIHQLYPATLYCDSIPQLYVPTLHLGVHCVHSKRHKPPNSVLRLESATLHSALSCESRPQLLLRIETATGTHCTRPKAPWRYSRRLLQMLHSCKRTEAFVASKHHCHQCSTLTCSCCPHTHHTDGVKNGSDQGRP